MHSKVTLTLEDELIKSAREYAKSQHKSLSQIVAEFFSGLSSKRSEKVGKKRGTFGPVTSKLLGSLKGVSLNEDDYKDHLKRKYL
jgi:hypothetical protein